MVAWFFWLATVITGAFFVMTIVLFICQWVIYFRVEKTMLERRRLSWFLNKGGGTVISETLLIVSLVSIWMSLLMSTLTLTGATHFWLKHSTKLVTTEPLSAYPKVTIVVPAPNE